MNKINCKRKNILYKSYFVSLIIFLFSLIIVFQLFYIQMSSQKKNYEKFINQNSIRINLIKARRGDIYDINGILLATSITHYDVHIDLKSIPNKIFERNIKFLCNYLEFFFKKSKYNFYKTLLYERKKGNKYFLLAKNLSYSDFKKIQQFPIFNKGQNYGGIIVEQKTSRIYPFETICKRTVGYNDYRGKTGLEGAFNKFLKGKDGKRLEQRISSKLWKPLKNYFKINLEDGNDIYTTIDIQVQNIVYNILLKQLIKSDAFHGCVVLMEVKSGEIRAIVNLKKDNDLKKYKDSQNFAVWEASEPGSTFKSIALLAALEDKKIDINTSVKNVDKIFKFKGSLIKDTHDIIKYQKLDVKKILEMSSNIGMAKLIYKSYKDNPYKFINHLHKWGLDKKLNIDIPGEGSPFIPNPNKKYWNELTLPWMSFGYNLKLTPLQILTFYNAIANNGQLVKPLFLKKIKFNNKNIEIFNPFIINKSIASYKSLNKIRNMLRGVVKNGTAKNFYNPKIPYSGKTGTTQLEYWIKNKPISYNSSFVGYFPSDLPKYSCIVLVSKPKRGYYGSDIAVPIFDNIVKSIFFNKIYKN